MKFKEVIHLRLFILFFPLAFGIGFLNCCIDPPPKPVGSHERMVEMLRVIAEESDQKNSFTGSAKLLELENLIRSPTWAKENPEKKWENLIALGRNRLKQGFEESAISAFQDALSLIDTVPAHHIREAKIRTHFDLGVAWMRRGESLNCCAQNHPDSCLIPIRGGGLHSEKAPSENAMGHFEEVLKITAGPSQLNWNLEARWLFNICAMTLGKYPDQIPSSHRISPGAFAGSEDFPEFTNIASDLGVNSFDLAGSVIADDFDNDGDIDIFASTWDPRGQLRFFKNRGNGEFDEFTKEANLEGLFGGLNMVQADYNNDGHLDILVLRGAWQFQDGKIPNSLLKNFGDGTFHDVTLSAGLGEVHYPTQTAAWSDFDQDGDLDLYVGNESPPDGAAFSQYGPTRKITSEKYPSQLFQNRGDGSFVDIAGKAGVQNFGFTKAVSWGDFDNDGNEDLYVSNFSGSNRLYRNKSDGTFENLAPELGVNKPFTSFPAWFWDVNNDGNLDIFVGSYDGSLADYAMQSLGGRPKRKASRLYINNGLGEFDERGRQYGLAGIFKPMGSNFGDLDNDGFLDFYIGAGTPKFEYVTPNLMFKNEAGLHFREVTYSGRFGHLQKGHGIAFADFDNDGDQDVYQQLGGAYPGDKYSNALFQNPGFDNNWLKIHLSGTKSNRWGIGARLRIRILENGKSREIYRWINSGGSFGANPLRPKIGLGKAERIESLEIRWPSKNSVQNFQDLPINSTLRIVEGKNNWTVEPGNLKPTSVH